MVRHSQHRGMVSHGLGSTLQWSRQRWAWTTGLSAAALVGLGAVWVGGTAVMARGELLDARAEAQILRTQLAAADISAATASADALARHANRAHQLTAGPAWALATKLPLVGDTVRTVRGITEAADELGAGALPKLVGVGTALDPSTLRSADGRIDVAAIRAAAPAIDAATASLERARAELAALPKATALDRVDVARREALAELTELTEAAQSAQRIARILPAMLGADTPQSYFVAFQNTAEARGTGGLPGAFAIVEADQGALKFRKFASDRTLDGISADITLDEDFEELYLGTRAKTLFLNSNLSPHFPYAAQIWRSMWERKSGQVVDGAIALDPQTLGYLLAVTGPAALPDGEAVTAENVVPLTLRDAYARFADDTPQARQAFLIEVAKAAAAKVTEAAGDPAELVQALRRATGERRLLAWSADPALQAELERTGISGSVPQTRAPYVGMTIVNEGGNKLDYYLERSLVWARTGCGRTRDVTVTVTLTNTAPKGLSAYVTSRSDRRTYEVAPGDHRVQLVYTATTNAAMEKVTLDGEPGFAGSGTERGHPVFNVDVELPRGVTRTIVFTLREPVGRGAPILHTQPLVRPLSAEVRDSPCP
ncbi:MAG: DUF4012 domain-containing protein [Sporichthyaceae bacterium]